MSDDYKYSQEVPGEITEKIQEPCENKKVGTKDYRYAKKTPDDNFTKIQETGENKNVSEQGDETIQKAQKKAKDADHAQNLPDEVKKKTQEVSDGIREFSGLALVLT